MNPSWYVDEIKKRYGNVNRARGVFLYTEKGTRLVDMHLDCGRSIMGRGNGSGKSMLMFKNALAKGLTSSFELTRKHRAEKAILKTLSGFANVYFFSSKESCAYAIIKAKNIDFSIEDIVSTSMDSWAYKNKIPMWKPWAIDNVSSENLVYVVPPFLLSQNVHIVVTKGDVEISETETNIPSCAFDGLARSFYDFEKEKPNRSESDFCLYDEVLGDYFERKSCYLFPTIAEKDYKNFVIHSMDKGLLLSPFFNVPSIVPFGVNLGDFKKLKQNPFTAEN